MSFADRYLPYIRQQFITSPLLALLPFCPLLTESSYRDQLLASAYFSSALSATLSPLLCANYQFVVYCSDFFVCLFCGWGSQSAKCTMLVYPRGDG
jgi:hypothetical protein